MIDFKNEQEGARAILGEAATILKKEDIDYVVLGGWIPFLFNSKILPHPGSFDVDLLLNPKTTRAQFDKNVVDEFKKQGYILPAKNKFQLFKSLSVNGEPIMFHIDLLHVNYAPYQDDDGLYINWGKMQSINGPGTDLIFSIPERFTETLEIVMPSGINQKVEVNFSNEVGFLSAKGRALASPKRKRDAYDIFLIITQSRDYKYLLEKSYELFNSALIYSKSIEMINKFFLEGEKTGVKNVKKYMLKYKDKILIPEEQMEEVIEKRMATFLGKLITRKTRV